MNNAKVELCADLDATKADSDKKSYRLIKLHNGLRALLVHDPPSAGSNRWAFLLFSCMVHAHTHSTMVHSIVFRKPCQYLPLL